MHVWCILFSFFFSISFVMIKTDVCLKKYEIILKQIILKVINCDWVTPTITNKSTSTIAASVLYCRKKDRAPLWFPVDLPPPKPTFVLHKPPTARLLNGFPPPLTSSLSPNLPFVCWFKRKLFKPWPSLLVNMITWPTNMTTWPTQTFCVFSLYKYLFSFSFNSKSPFFFQLSKDLRWS